MNSELSIPINEKAENANGFCRLSWLQRIGFGSGDLAQNLIYQTISMYLLFFRSEERRVGKECRL